MFGLVKLTPANSRDRFVYDVKVDSQTGKINNVSCKIVYSSSHEEPGYRFIS